MYDPVLDPEMTRTGAAKSGFTNAEKAAKYDAIKSEMDFREKAAPLVAQAERTGAEKLMAEIAAQREAERMSDQGNYGLADLVRGPSAGQLASREGMSKAWEQKESLRNAYDSQVPYGGGWDPISGSAGAAAYAVSGKYKDDAAYANKYAVEDLRDKATRGRSLAIEELIAKGVNPQQAVNMVESASGIQGGLSDLFKQQGYK